MIAILRRPRLVLQGNANFQRYAFREDATGAPGVITYTPFDALDHRDYIDYAIVNTAQDAMQTGRINFVHAITPSTSELTSHQDGDQVAFPGPITPTFLQTDWSDMEIAFSEKEGGEPFQTTGKIPFADGVPITVTPPAAGIDVYMSIHLHRGSQCATVSTYFPILPTVRDVHEVDVSAGGQQTIVLADLMPGATTEELVFLGGATHGAAQFPAPTGAGHPILVPSSTGVASVGSDVTVEYALDQYTTTQYRDQGMWIDWPLGDPAGAYTIDAVVGAVPVVRLSGPGLIEVSA